MDPKIRQALALAQGLVPLLCEKKGTTNNFELVFPKSKELYDITEKLDVKVMMLNAFTDLPKDVKFTDLILERHVSLHLKQSLVNFFGAITAYGKKTDDKAKDELDSALAIAISHYVLDLLQLLMLAGEDIEPFRQYIE